MDPIFDASRSSYFLEIGLPAEKCKKTLAIGIKIFKQDKPELWGQLSFMDQLAQRHRIIQLPKSPHLNENEIVCESDTGEMFRFLFVTKDVWDHQAKYLVKDSDRLEKKMNDTDDVQKYLQSIYP